jgi:hypothetical protein
MPGEILTAEPAADAEPFAALSNSAVISTPGLYKAGGAPESCAHDDRLNIRSVNSKADKTLINYLS